MDYKWASRRELFNPTFRGLMAAISIYKKPQGEAPEGSDIVSYHPERENLVAVDTGRSTAILNQLPEPLFPASGTGFRSAAFNLLLGWNSTRRQGGTPTGSRIFGLYTRCSPRSRISRDPRPNHAGHNSSSLKASSRIIRGDSSYSPSC
jgi:hypothetical protein